MTQPRERWLPKMWRRCSNIWPVFAFCFKGSWSLVPIDWAALRFHRRFPRFPWGEAQRRAMHETKT